MGDSPNNPGHHDDANLAPLEPGWCDRLLRILNAKFRRLRISPQDLEDAVQDALLKWLTDHPTFDDRAEAFVWFYGKARDYLCNIDRRTRRRSKLHPAGTPDSHERDARDSELDRALREAVDLLQERERRVVSCWLDGRTVEQTANEIGLSKSTVRDARARVREILTSRLGDPAEGTN